MTGCSRVGTARVAIPHVAFIVNVPTARELEIANAGDRQAAAKENVIASFTYGTTRRQRRTISSKPDNLRHGQMRFAKNNFAGKGPGLLAAPLVL
jgi:hypothetical protein